MTWQEVEASSHEWDTLLLGNGLSINVWKPFAYDELFEYAEDGGRGSQRSNWQSSPGR